MKGVLSCPGLDTPRALSAPAGAMLPIPPLLTVGHYVVDQLRLDDGNGHTIAAEPSIATINVIDKVIVTSVSSRPLSLDEIRDRGIVIGDKNFTAYQFTFGYRDAGGPGDAGPTWPS